MPQRRSMTGELKRFFASIRVPVFLLDTESRFAFGNAAFTEALGVDATSLLGRACRYHSQPLDDPLDEFATSISPPPEVQRGVVLRGELHLPSMSEPVAVTWLPLPTASGQQMQVIGILDELPFPDADPTFQQLQDLHTQLGAYREQMRRKYPLDFVIGSHPTTQKVRDQLDVAISGDMNVTVIAPTYGDRERISRSVFYNRPPLHGRLLPLSCDLLDTELLESSLDSFQSSRADSFTGQDVPDTLLLQDLDQLSLECQILLERRLRHRDWDYRVIATSIRDLEEIEFSPKIAAVFSTLTLRVVPLVERKEDIPLLAQHFVERWNRTGKQRSGFTRPAVEYLEAYNWPGDADELSDVVESSCESASGSRIEVEDLPKKIHWWLEDLTNPRDEYPTIELDELLQSIEMRLVKRALELSDGNKSQAARLLGITRMRVIRRVSEME